MQSSYVGMFEVSDMYMHSNFIRTGRGMASCPGICLFTAICIDVLGIRSHKHMYMYPPITYAHTLPRGVSMCMGYVFMDRIQKWVASLWGVDPSLWMVQNPKTRKGKGRKVIGRTRKGHARKGTTCQIKDKKGWKGKGKQRKRKGRERNMIGK